MTSTAEMIRTHPQPTDLDGARLAEVIDQLERCATTCTQCADACLAEPDLSAELATCIRLDLDCADICETTARVLARQTELRHEFVRELLDACVAACGACGDECAGHAEHMEHCRICAEECRACRSACEELRGLLAA